MFNDLSSIVLLEHYPELFTLKIHHGGLFTKRPGRQYIQGKISYVDLVDGDELSVHEINAMVKELGYTGKYPMYYHFLTPDCNLDVGLRALGNDQDVLNLMKYTLTTKVIEVYTEQIITTVFTYNKSPGGPKVVIEELPDENVVIPESTMKSKKQGSSSCKKRLALEWIGTEEYTPRVDEVVSDREAEREVDTNLGPESGHDEDFDPFWGLGGERSLGDETSLGDEPVKEPSMGDEPVKEPSLGKGPILEDDSDDDSDYMEEEMAEVDVDMSNFSSIIDWNVEWLGSKEELVEDKRFEEDDQFEADAFYSTDDSDLEGPRKDKLRESFGNKKEIKERVAKHSIETRRDLSILKNDSVRMRVICRGKVPICNERDGESSQSKSKQSKSTTKKDEGPICPWVLHVSTSGEDKTWVVKTYNDVHKCLQSRKIRQCTSSFLSTQMEGTIAPNPNIPIGALKEQLQGKLQLQLSRQKIFRAKAKAMERLQGTYTAQYPLLRDYVLELKKTNPGTTVKLEVEPQPLSDSTDRQFKRIYVCLGPLKKGFKAIGRELLGLDGAFMKGPYPGQILSAVGIDLNIGTYPLAYAIGIIPAVAKVFPSAEHRFCLRHIHENMKKTWKGKEYKDLLWKTATATTVNQFGRCMNQMRTLNREAHDWLKEIPPHTWSRSHFTGRAHSDVVLNNMCEVFNRQLIDGRDKPIIMCLEYIREYLMKRIVNVKKMIAKSEGILTPTATKLLDEVKSQACGYTVLWSGGPKYQVNGPWNEQCVVNPSEKDCTCRKWELTGIPCMHVVACIWFMQANGEVYSFHIDPISGREHWPHADYGTTVTAPTHHTQIGRPKKKRRKECRRNKPTHCVWIKAAKAWEDCDLQEVQQKSAPVSLPNVKGISVFPNSYFIMQFQKHIFNNGRMTIPASFVRMWRLDIHDECLLIVGGSRYHMQMVVHEDKRRSDIIPDHVVIKGDFGFMEEHNITTNSWVKFRLCQTAYDRPLFGNYHVVFHKKIQKREIEDRERKVKVKT
ncbi:hypothetical protein OSB04_020629 [Centaurea solstitialis]|uniref:SWIM-type domain-containing protein n=1 Tax=Centaurea solstitialis TaxID=347529 RepID=A0AA38T616_9ASTR|nr:hypothetical protein OSB04_020629 [Centaurea solstitialis]